MFPMAAGSRLPGPGRGAGSSAWCGEGGRLDSGFAAQYGARSGFHDETIDRYPPPCEPGEKPVDPEDYFRRWRFNHVTTVERVTGFKRGGGASGVEYLRRMPGVGLLPELRHLRGDL